MARPRLGERPRKPPAPKRSALPSLVWRNLGLAAAAVILGGGTLVSVHILGLGQTDGTQKPDANRLAIKAATVLRAASPVAAPADAAPAKPSQASQAGTAQAGTAQAETPPTRKSSGEAPQAAARPAIAPTPADFARPAFLEPIDPQASLLNPEPTVAPAQESAMAADDGVDPVEVASIPTPPAADVAPLPQKRPSDIPAASDDDGDRASRGRTAKITMDINLRSGPRRASSVIGTIPAGTKVTLIGCRSWCEVVAKGKHGYVYRRAVDR